MTRAAPTHADRARHAARLGCVVSLVTAGILAPSGACQPSEASTGGLRFPTAVAVTSDNRFILVASSNFDLRYDAGALHSFDLAAMRAAIDGCAAVPCTFEDLSRFMVSEVLVGSHTSGLALSPRGDRVYLAVRSEVDLTWIDIDPETGGLSCEGAGRPEVCAAHRRTTETASSCGRTPVLSGDPIGVVAGRAEDLGGAPGLDYILMFHRNGRASLFVDRLVGSASEPVLTHTTDGLPLDIVNVSFDASSDLVWTHSASIVGTRPTRDIGFAGVAYDAATPECSSVFSAGRLPLRGVDDALDTRDATFSADGSRAFVLARRPEAILTIDLESQPLFPSEAAIDRVSHVGIAPSRLERVDVGARTVLAATCFDDGEVWFVDAETGATAGVVPGFHGAYDLAVDRPAQLAWVVDFRDSVLRAIDTAPLADGREPRLVATFGRVRAVQMLR